MPFPVAAVAIGGVLRGAAGAAARGAMTTARFGLKGGKGASGMAANAAINNSLSSSQFSGTSPSVNITGPAVHEMLGKRPK
jgi:hypothetical protein